RNGNRIDEVASCGLWWAADNDCFQGLDPDQYLAMLDAIAQVNLARLLFVTVPDVVGDWYGTLTLFRSWLPALQKRNFPPALVAQDGLTSERVSWNELACLFIGGSTEWKEGSEAIELIREARKRGIWVHVGRINTLRRLQHFEQVGI